MLHLWKPPPHISGGALLGFLKPVLMSACSSPPGGYYRHMVYPFAVAIVISSWILIGSSLGTQTHEDILASSENRSGQPTQFQFNATGISYQKVTGSTNEGPPWGSKLTPLSDSFTTYNFSQTVTIPNMQRFDCTLTMNQETGHQRWSDTVEIDTVQRNRLWETNVVHQDLWRNL